MRYFITQYESGNVYIEKELRQYVHDEREYSEAEIVCRVKIVRDINSFEIGQLHHLTQGSSKIRYYSDTLEELKEEASLLAL